MTLAIAHTALVALCNADPNRCERAYVGNTIGQVRLALQPLTPSPTQQPTGAPCSPRATRPTAPARERARRTPSPTSCSICGVLSPSLTHRSRSEVVVTSRTQELRLRRQEPAGQDAERRTDERRQLEGRVHGRGALVHGAACWRKDRLPHRRLRCSLERMRCRPIAAPPRLS